MCQRGGSLGAESFFDGPFLRPIVYGVVVDCLAERTTCGSPSSRPVFDNIDDFRGELLRLWERDDL